jgi:DNA-binding response OmpR family regulator
MTHRILIVEDSDDVRDSYVRWFEKEGFEVTQARDGEQAWSLSRRHRPDVVLLDVELPGMDGYTLAGKWRADPQMARVPVVVLSGRRGDEHERKAQEAGCLIALAKPCLPDMILAAIRGALPT